MSGFYPETNIEPLYPVVDTGFLPTASQGVESNVDPLYPVVDTDFLPAVPQRVTSKQIISLVAYTHTQSATSDQWVVTHNLGFKPNVTVFNSAGDIVEGHIIHNSINQLTLQFSSTMSGVAQLS